MIYGGKLGERGLHTSLERYLFLFQSPNHHLFVSSAILRQKFCFHPAPVAMMLDNEGSKLGEKPRLPRGDSNPP